MAKGNENIEPEEETPSVDWDQFLSEHKDDISKLADGWIKTWSKSSHFASLSRFIVVMSALLAGVILTYVGKISGETISGFVGVIIGYVLSKEKF